MRALTFVSMMLVAISGATAHSLTAESKDPAAAVSNQVGQANLATERICMRCRFGG